MNTPVLLLACLPALIIIVAFHGMSSFSRFRILDANRNDDYFRVYGFNRSSREQPILQLIDYGIPGSGVGPALDCITAHLKNTLVRRATK